MSKGNETVIRTVRMRIQVLLLAALVLAAFSLSSARPYFDPPDSENNAPVYWVAVFMVPKQDIDEGPFLEDTDRLYNKIIGTGHKCVKNGNIDINDRCKDVAEHTISNCEYLSIAWNASTSTLKLIADGRATDEHSSHSGKIFSHQCLGIPFKDCLEQNLDRMANSVREHDENCHQKGKRCAVNPSSEQFEH
jgi:hypothetical protein